MATTESECIQALRTAAERLGESPTKAQYEDLGLTPASATIVRTMGSWNAAKEAADLATNPSTGSRVGPKPDGVDLPPETTWEDLSVDQRWHYRNTEWNAERTLNRRTRLRRWVNERKAEVGCDRCPASDPACLDFHHERPEDKEMEIGTMVTYGYGKDALRAEIEKCVVLCANCHRREHSVDDRRETDLRAWVSEQKRDRGGCRQCGEDDPVCLDFHHGDGSKGATVSQLVSDGRSRADVRAEMRNCELLCANCHRRLHHEPPDTAGPSSQHS